MSDAVIKATFSEWKMVKTRKVLQIICEVPIENTQQVLETFGAPMPDSETWVAIALMGKEPVAQKGGKLAQIAGIMCSKPSFWKWVNDKTKCVIHDEDDAASYIRATCEINSRAELDHNSDAAHAFNQIRSQYEAWLNI